MKYVLLTFILFLISYSSLSQLEKIKFNAAYTIDECSGDLYVYGQNSSDSLVIVQLDENLNFINTCSLLIPKKNKNISIYPSCIGLQVILSNKEDSLIVFLSDKLKTTSDTDVIDKIKYYSSNSSAFNENEIYLFLSKSNYDYNRIYKSLFDSRKKRLESFSSLTSLLYNNYDQKNKLVIYHKENNNFLLKNEVLLPPDIQSVCCIGKVTNKKVDFVGLTNSELIFYSYEIETKKFFKGKSYLRSEVGINIPSDLSYDKFKDRFIMHSAKINTSVEGTELFTKVKVFDRNFNLLDIGFVNSRTSLPNSKVLSGKTRIPVQFNYQTKITKNGIYLHESVYRSATQSGGEFYSTEYINEYLNDLFIDSANQITQSSYSRENDKNKFADADQHKVRDMFNEFIVDNGIFYHISRDKLSLNKKTSNLYYIDFSSLSFGEKIGLPTVIGRDQFPFKIRTDWGRSLIYQSKDESKLLWLKAEKAKVKLEPYVEYNILITNTHNK